jgi:predicted GNAT family acetyltransferase
MFDSRELRRHQIRKILTSRRGVMARIARELDLTHSCVATVLRGRGKSARVMDAARRAAQEILAEESRA